MRKRKTGNFLGAPKLLSQSRTIGALHDSSERYRFFHPILHRIHSNKPNSLCNQLQLTAGIMDDENRNDTYDDDNLYRPFRSASVPCGNRCPSRALVTALMGHIATMQRDIDELQQFQEWALLQIRTMKCDAKSEPKREGAKLEDVVRSINTKGSPAVKPSPCTPVDATREGTSSSEKLDEDISEELAHSQTRISNALSNERRSKRPRKKYPINCTFKADPCAFNLTLDETETQRSDSVPESEESGSSNAETKSPPRRGK